MLAAHLMVQGNPPFRHARASTARVEGCCGAGRTSPFLSYCQGRKKQLSEAGLEIVVIPRVTRLESPVDASDRVVAGGRSRGVSPSAVRERGSGVSSLSSLSSAAPPTGELSMSSCVV